MMFFLIIQNVPGDFSFLTPTTPLPPYLANIVNILDPDIIVLGGGLSNIDFLYEVGKQAVYDHVFSDVIDTSIIKNKLGDSAGVFGAALLGEIG